MKKRLLSLLLALTLACSLLVFPASAVEVLDEGDYGSLHWVLTSDGTVTISGTGIIDSGLKDNWTQWGKALKSIVMEPGITSIGYSAFEYCTNLTSVTIPNSVTSIRGQAFSNCSSLTNVTIPDSVTNIGNSAFQDCSKLTSVTIPDSITSIGNSAFSGCSSLANVTIPDGVTSIGDSTFYGCSSLTNVTIPDGVSSIGDSTFYGCSSLTNVTIPDGVTSIGDFTFSCCSNLTGVSLPVSITSIGICAFSDCSSLNSVIIPDGVTSIGIEAFYNCSSMESLTFAGSGISISDSAFHGCTNLLSIQFPLNLSLGTKSFDGCTGLMTIIIPSIDTISEYAFQNCTALESITIENDVKTIDSYAFLGCSALKTVTLPDTLSKVNTGAFRNCDSIKDVYFGGNSTQWSEIAIKSYNEPLTGANIHYSSAPAKIVSNPADVTTIAGVTASFTVAVTGDVTSYQWQVKIPGGEWANCDCNAATLEFTAEDSMNGNQYRCIVTDVDRNTVSSEAATLTVETPSLKIVQQPVDYAGNYKDWAEFFCVAEGEDVSYYWQYSTDDGETWNDSDGVGYRAECYIISRTKGRLYRCTVSDKYGNEQLSNIARVIMNASVITQPKNATASIGKIASFKMEADANGQLTYQWQYKTPVGAWKNSSSKTVGYNTDTLQVVATEARNGYQYRCKVTDQDGNVVTSEPATLTIAQAVVITASPADSFATAGRVSSFYTAAEGEGLTYQWQYKNPATGVWKNCSAATIGYNTQTLIVYGASNGVNRHGYQYRCVVTDAYGNTATTEAATLTVFAIKTQPKDAAVTGSGKATFKVAATGENLTYQWQYKTPTGAWKNCSSATQGYNTAALTVQGVSGKTNRNGYQYRCVVTSGSKMLTSNAVILTVN